MMRFTPRALRGSGFFLAGLLLALACSSTGTPDTGDQTSAAGGTSAHGGTSHGGLGGGFSGSSAGGHGSLDASPDGLTIPDADSGVVDGSGLQDALPDVGAADACTGDHLGPGPITRVCAPSTDDECAGGSDTNPALPNGMYGNGFDDDCDGKVDEGCLCDSAHPPGTTRDCYLTPASQADPATMAPTGWCKDNTKGTVACIQTGGTEMGQAVWDGYCKGAQPPFADDICAAGDFNCDGLDSNSQTLDCTCGMPTVECPTDAWVISPYPDPKDTTKKRPNDFDPNPNSPFIIDGNSWITNAMGASATGWKWTITGGDCDNILPHPTFAIYNGPDTTTAGRYGVLVKNVGSNGAQHGLSLGPVADGCDGCSAHQIWPAFSLSGDYVVQGEFDLAGKHYECSVKVKVRAKGLRAEMCWDMGSTVDPVFNTSSTDVDLHVSRLQGANGGAHGWFDTTGMAPNSDDCFYDCLSGCRTGNKGYCALAFQKAPPPGWGYPASAADSCHGWGSRREAGQSCDNPRLDLDNISCGTAVEDPTDPNFCGPENINLDAPNSGDQFAVGVHYYTGTTDQHPHVNIYCNGERKLAVGYDPTTNPPILKPELTYAYTDGNQPDALYAGDFWEVVRVTWSGDPMDPCAVEPIPSKAPKAKQDGMANVCVDTNAQNSPGQAKPQKSQWYFAPGMGYPTAPAAPPGDLCWH